MARAKKEALPKPPWAMTEEEKAAVATEQAQEQQEQQEAIERQPAEKPKSKYAFGKLWEVVCPFDERVSAMFHVGTQWGTLLAPVKNDDGKGELRRTRLQAPYWRGLENIIHPLTEEPLRNPDPDDLDSYTVVASTLFHLWGTTFYTWLYKDGWNQAVEEAGGVDPKN